MVRSGSDNLAFQTDPLRPLVWTSTYDFCRAGTSRLDRTVATSAPTDGTLDTVGCGTNTGRVVDIVYVSSCKSKLTTTARIPRVTGRFVRFVARGSARSPVDDRFVCLLSSFLRVGTLSRLLR